MGNQLNMTPDVLLGLFFPLCGKSEEVQEGAKLSLFKIL